MKQLDRIPGGAALTSDPNDGDASGVFSSQPMGRALALVQRWSALHARAAQRPEDVRALRRKIESLLGNCMSRLVALEPTVAQAGGGEIDELLDATYVLERLEWCTLHNVPYIDRPRVPRAG